MRNETRFIGWTAALIILSVTVLLVPARTAAQNMILHSFNDNGKDGSNPYAGLILDSAGNLYGTTLGGGSHYGGTVFGLTPGTGGGWTEKVLYSFATGYNPYAGLIFDTAGNLYGTTWGGGTGTIAAGTVFELSPNASGTWTAKPLHSFGQSKDGQYPSAGLVFDASGNLFGTTTLGGTQSFGTVFELSPKSGGWTEKVLHSFTHNFIDGFTPAAGVTLDAAGNLYGTTVNGGVLGAGTVFELTPTADGRWTESILHNFDFNGQDGNNPTSTVVFDTNGDLFGTTSGGGTYAAGTVFELMPTAGGVWTEKILHTFGKDGVVPNAGLVIDGAGNLYGTTEPTPHYNIGTVFKLSPNGSGGWKNVLLRTFTDFPQNGPAPIGGVVIDSTGEIFGTTSFGGLYGYGTVFDLRP